MELLESLENVASLSRGTSSSPTHMPHLAETAESAQAAANNAAANKLSKYSILATIIIRSNRRRSRRTLEPWIFRTHRWPRQKNLPNYTRTIGNTISFPKTVHIAAEGKRTSIQKHVFSRVIFVPVSVPLQTTPNLQFLACRLRAGGRKKKIIITIIKCLNGMQVQNGL